MQCFKNLIDLVLLQLKMTLGKYLQLYVSLLCYELYTWFWSNVIHDYDSVLTVCAKYQNNEFNQELWVQTVCVNEVNEIRRHVYVCACHLEMCISIFVILQKEILGKDWLFSLGMWYYGTQYKRFGSNWKHSAKFKNIPLVTFDGFFHSPLTFDGLFHSEIQFYQDL